MDESIRAEADSLRSSLDAFMKSVQGYATQHDMRMGMERRQLLRRISALEHAVELAKVAVSESESRYEQLALRRQADAAAALQVEQDLLRQAKVVSDEIAHHSELRFEVERLRRENAACDAREKEHQHQIEIFKEKYFKEADNVAKLRENRGGFLFGAIRSTCLPNILHFCDRRSVVNLARCSFSMHAMVEMCMSKMLHADFLSLHTGDPSAASPGYFHDARDRLSFSSGHTMSAAEQHRKLSDSGTDTGSIAAPTAPSSASRTPSLGDHSRQQSSRSIMGLFGRRPDATPPRPAVNTTAPSAQSHQQRGVALDYKQASALMHKSHALEVKVTEQRLEIEDLLEKLKAVDLVKVALQRRIVDMERSVAEANVQRDTAVNQKNIDRVTLTFLAENNNSLEAQLAQRTAERDAAIQKAKDLESTIMKAQTSPSAASPEGTPAPRDDVKLRERIRTLEDALQMARREIATYKAGPDAAIRRSSLDMTSGLSAGDISTARRDSSTMSREALIEALSALEHEYAVAKSTWIDQRRALVSENQRLRGDSARTLRS